MTNKEREAIRSLLALGLAGHTLHLRRKRDAPAKNIAQALAHLDELGELFNTALTRNPTVYRVIVEILFTEIHDEEIYRDHQAQDQA